MIKSLTKKKQLSICRQQLRALLKSVTRITEISVVRPEPLCVGFGKSGIEFDRFPEATISFTVRLKKNGKIV